MKMETKNGIRAFYAKDRKAWRAWLAKNAESEKAVWLILYRKGASAKTVSYAEAVEEALCFGWIDSKANKRDGESYYQYFAQRKPRSNWSKSNKERVARLTALGLMTERGLALVEAAKQNGAWAALDTVDALVQPAGLEKALAKNKKAALHFQAFPPSLKKQILEWVGNARREETRQKRIDETVSLAEKNKRANQYRPAK